MSIFLIVIVFVIIAGLLTWFLLSHDHGEKEPVSALWMAAGLGLLGAILAGVIEDHVIPLHLLEGYDQPLGPMFIATLGVGVIEESLKFIPLALIIYKRKYFNEHTDGVIYFALAGLGFGIPENILYTVNFGEKAGLARILLTPIFHAATTAMVGYFLIKSKIDHKPLTITALAFGLAILIHGVYDFGLSSGVVLFQFISLMITVAISAMLFIFFMRANELDREEGLSIVGHNNFCRACGYPNPKHGLYCTHCGKYA